MFRNSKNDHITMDQRMRRKNSLPLERIREFPFLLWIMPSIRIIYDHQAKE